MKSKTEGKKEEMVTRLELDTCRSLNEALRKKEADYKERIDTLERALELACSRIWMFSSKEGNITELCQKYLREAAGDKMAGI